MPLKDKAARAAYERDRYQRLRKDILSKKYKIYHADPRSALDKRASHKYKTDAGEHYATLYKKQHGLCAICGDDETNSHHGRLAIDHKQNPHKLRGLLCSHCNLGLGHFKDRADLLEQGARYLRKYNE